MEDMQAQIISIHTLLAEGDDFEDMVFVVQDISIHTLLAEGDKIAGAAFDDLTISIHTLLAEGDGNLHHKDLQ